LFQDGENGGACVEMRMVDVIGGLVQLLLESLLVFWRKVPMYTLQFHFGKSAAGYCSTEKHLPNIPEKAYLFCQF